MAYSTSNPPQLLSGSFTRSNGASIWTYQSSDLVATVLGSDYISNGDALGMKANDEVIVIDETNNLKFETIVTSVTAGGAASLGISSADAVQTLAAAKTVTAAETGTTFFLGLAGGFTTTLPAPAAGLRYKFVVSVDPTTSYVIVTNGGADIMKGGVNELEVDTADDGPYDNNADTLNLVANIAVVGDWVEFISDGTSWFFTGQTNADGGVTTSTT